MPKGIANGALHGVTEADAMFAGIPESGFGLGSDSAPVTLVGYIDLQCPFCRQFETTVMPGVVKEYVKTGKLTVETRLLGFIPGPPDANSAYGRRAAIAASFQDRAFPFIELLYYNQGEEQSGWLDEKMVAAAAASVTGMDASKLLGDMGSEKVTKIAAELDTMWHADHVSATPTLFVGPSGTHGKPVKDDEKSLVAAIEAALAR